MSEKAFETAVNLVRSSAMGGAHKLAVLHVFDQASQTGPIDRQPKHIRHTFEAKAIKHEVDMEWHQAEVRAAPPRVGWASTTGAGGRVIVGDAGKILWTFCFSRRRAVLTFRPLARSATILRVRLSPTSLTSTAATYGPHGPCHHLLYYAAPLCRRFSCVKLSLTALAGWGVAVPPGAGPWSVWHAQG